MKKKLKLTTLHKSGISKLQMNLVLGGNVASSSCDGCLCNTDVSGQSSTNNSKARTSSGIS